MKITGQEGGQALLQQLGSASQVILGVTGSDGTQTDKVYEFKK